MVNQIAILLDVVHVNTLCTLLLERGQTPALRSIPIQTAGHTNRQTGCLCQVIESTRNVISWQPHILQRLDLAVVLSCDGSGSTSLYVAFATPVVCGAIPCVAGPQE